MVKNLTSLEIVKGDRTFRLILDADSPLGECFDVLSEMRAFVVQKIQEAEQQAKQAEEPVAEE